MIKVKFAGLSLTALATVMLLQIGCGGSKPARFYMLSSINNPVGENRATNKNGEISIGIGPVTFPAYLQRPQIVTYLSANQIYLADFDRWAEPLEDNFTNVLSRNLSNILSTDNIYLFPWPSGIIVQYQLTINVIRFELEHNGKISLIVNWLVFRLPERKLLITKKSEYSQTLALDEKMKAEEKYSRIVSAMSRTLADFSSEIADGILSIQNH
ncbi:MAG: membrane integrity-associated transporter subunit PqiC [Calditrichia bacterium]